MCDQKLIRRGLFNTKTGEISHTNFKLQEMLDAKNGNKDLIEFRLGRANFSLQPFKELLPTGKEGLIKPLENIYLQYRKAEKEKELEAKKEIKALLSKILLAVRGERDSNMYVSELLTGELIEVKQQIAETETTLDALKRQL